MDRMDDERLLREYADGGSEAAFGELVGRHLGMVYSAARRMVGDEQLAEDVSQAVFLVLSQRAGRLKIRSLGGWLHRVTWYAATRAKASEQRRRGHERRAGEESLAMRSEDVAAVWG